MEISIKDFPFFNDKKGLVYGDNASTVQKPQRVLDAIMRFYTDHNANIYRGIHAFGELATQQYEQARTIVAEFIGAEPQEVIFTSGATDSINFVAATWAKAHIAQNDEILITQLEHHANFLPWQHLAQAVGAQLRIIPVLADGTLDMSVLKTMVTPRTKLIAITHASNAIGTHVDVMPFVQAARSVGAKILLDAAQSVAHQNIDVRALGVDFLVFSGHKLGGPTGIGVLYIAKALHEVTPPYRFGGGMVHHVGTDRSQWLSSPYKFEAGTPPISSAIGLGAAIEYLRQISFDQMNHHESQLCSQLIDGLSSYERIRILGPIDQLKNKGHLVSFVVEGIHAHDVAAYLDTQGICVRAGNHCAQPLAHALNYTASVRVSFWLYNTHQHVDRIIQALDGLIKK